jgi:hypothetical protein
MATKKNKTKHAKNMASFMNAKSTAELKKEVEKILAEEIPDPKDPQLEFVRPPDALPPSAEDERAARAANERAADERAFDMLDRIERAKLRDAHSQRH